MGVVQSKRRTKNQDPSSSPTRNQHASMFTERSASYDSKRSTHHSTLPRHATRSISDEVVLVKRNNTLAVRHNRQRRQLQPEGYVGVESTSRFLPEDWEAQDRDISVICHLFYLPDTMFLITFLLSLLATFCIETTIGWVMKINTSSSLI